MAVTKKLINVANEFAKALTELTGFEVELYHYSSDKRGVDIDAYTEDYNVVALWNKFVLRRDPESREYFLNGLFAYPSTDEGGFRLQDFTYSFTDVADGIAQFKEKYEVCAENVKPPKSKIVKQFQCQCLYDELQSDVSKMSYTRTSEQLDFCESCSRYDYCQKVAKLNDRLVDIKTNRSSAELRMEQEEVYKFDLGTIVRLNAPTSSKFDTDLKVVGIQKSIVSGEQKGANRGKYWTYKEYDYSYQLETIDGKLIQELFSRNEIRKIG